MECVTRIGQIELSTGILAGGKSSRIGQDKAFLTVEGMAFLDILAEELSKIAEPTLSVAERLPELTLRQVVDEYSGIGPIEGIRRLLSEAETEAVFICGVDMPFLKTPLIRYMCEFISSDHDCYCMVSEGKVQSLCAIYTKRCLPYIEQAIAAGEYRLTELLRKMSTKYIDISYTCFPKKWLSNINTPEEYKRLQTPHMAAVCGFKNSGKTTFIEKAIGFLKQDGYSVAVIKHDGHDFEPDREGTDSYRFYRAGAACSVVYSHQKYAMTRCGEPVLEDLIRQCGDVDVILLEGNKESSYPKFWMSEQLWNVPAEVLYQELKRVLGI